MTKFKAFILGMKEFRLTFTTYFENYNESLSYDKGRDFAHKITFRRFDN